MDDELNYRGFVIVAMPLRLADGGWTHDGYVQEYLQYAVEVEKFDAAIQHPTRDEAVKAILAQGRQLIDAKWG